ncbi:MAG: hypothetical protein LBH42_01845, partial [Treponema sp.]|nr:hypothetical protein [Treponema sp.]
MKQGVKKPRTNSAKKRKRKKISIRDRIYAVSVAAALVSVAAICSMAIMYCRSTDVRNEAGEIAQEETGAVENR